MSPWREQEARNEAGFRDQNEWIDATSDAFGTGELTAFVCECGDAACTEPIELTKPEYDAVRSIAVRFAIVRNHENPEAEVVVSEHARYTVVDKVGISRRIALATDPRRNRPRRRP